MSKEFLYKCGDVKVGDWVRFYQNARLIIGEVQYIWIQLNKTYIATDVGTVASNSVLEIRPAATETNKELDK